MFEKVNPCHPDKVADRIAGAIVDLAYKKENNTKIAVEVLLGHGDCHVIIETSANIGYADVHDAVHRIAGNINSDVKIAIQDKHLADNQKYGVRCGDNGIFKGLPVTYEQEKLSRIAREIYEKYPTDGKYILDLNDFIICQSNADSKALKKEYPDARINPLGDWTGGPNVDSGATNRKLGSDMGDAVTGGGLHGKDLSKADVSVNIACHLMAQETGKQVSAMCAIGDDKIEFRIGDDLFYDTETKHYSDVVMLAKMYINNIGGFEKFAEWGLI